MIFNSELDQRAAKVCGFITTFPDWRVSSRVLKREVSTDHQLKTLEALKTRIREGEEAAMEEHIESMLKHLGAITMARFLAAKQQKESGGGE